MHNSSKWITAPYLLNSDNHNEDPAPILRRQFNLTAKPTLAVLKYCPLGFGWLSVNGHSCEGAELYPSFSDYDKRVYYITRDITKELSEGDNALAIMLGRGRFDFSTESVWGFEKAPWRSRVCLRLELELTFSDGSLQRIVSDENWLASAGHCLMNSVYEGETWDARLEPEGWNSASKLTDDWKPSEIVQGPRGTLQEEYIPPVKQLARFKPKTITIGKNGSTILDYGKMISGWAEISLDASPGTEVCVSYFEKLESNGEPHQVNTYWTGRFQEDRFICSGKGVDSFRPRFTYKGFRYIMVSGNPKKLTNESIIAIQANNDVKTNGTFKCSHALLNWIQKTCREALCNNLHGIITDTPTYEKNGWTGDAQLTCEMGLYNFDMSDLYKKFCADIRDSQLPSGELAPIVPTSGWGTTGCGFGWDAIHGAVPAWDASLFIIPWQVYRHTGRIDLIAENYEAMKHYLEFLTDQADDKGVLVCGLGDWLAPPETPEGTSGTPEGASLSSNCWHYYLSHLLSAMAKLLGDTSLHEKLETRKKEIAVLFHKHFYNPKKRYYETPGKEGFRQTSQILPLAFDLVPAKYKENVLDALLNNLKERNNRLDTGILGTRYLLDVLTDNGYADVAYRIVTQEDFPSWGFWKKIGQVSLGEAWEPTSRSWSHHMFGVVSGWFYSGLCGIRPAEPGFKTIRIAPNFPKEVRTANATLNLAGGKLKCDLITENEKRTIRVVIPPGHDALVALPGKALRKVKTGEFVFPL